MEPFKNMLNVAAATQIATALGKAYPRFDTKVFLADLEKELEPLELKGRMAHLAAKLAKVLPQDPIKSFPILIKSLENLEGFKVWPLTHFVATHGLDHFELSMEALRAMTQVFTSEWAVRPFLIAEETRTLKVLKQWAKDENEHVRRLASEGSRPLLPWGQRIPRFVADPELTVDILESLKNDPSPYVRKSVANHINDHSKHHGEWVVTLLSQWAKSAPKERQWIIRHASRTLVKKGHKGALALHGIKAADIAVSQPKVHSMKVKLGQTLLVSVKLVNRGTTRARVIVDHELKLLGKNGKPRSKIFKGKKLELAASESRLLEFRIPIRAVTVRAYYPGRQSWAVIVNGVKGKELPFTLMT